MPDRSVREIIEKQNSVMANAEITVSAAAQLMQQHHIGAVLITEGEHLAGIFTERDALFRVIAAGRDPAATRIAEVMTRDPLTVTPDRSFRHALHLMYEGDFRHVPVVADGRPLGMVSARDALGPDLKQFIGDLETREHIGEILG